jgi:copper resistance protein C
MQRTFLWSLLAASAFCVLAATASAHALLARANPPVGASVKGPVTVLHLRFTERVEPSLCRLTVMDVAHHMIAVTDLASEGDARMLVARLPALAPGAYHVIWHVVSVDTHVTEGDYSFTVIP